ncbi:MAG: response regulator [Candidatus Promineifilaceae bacterium]
MRDEATILVVEDDEPLLEGLLELFQVTDLGYQLHTLGACDGKAGLELIGQHAPDLVISDIMMPRIDGLEFLQRVRQNPAWVHIPFIFLTARGTRQDVLEGKLGGAELYIIKPYDNDELVRLVRSQLDRTFQLRRERQRKLELLSRNIFEVLNHEFRTPLHIVTGYSHLLAAELPGSDANSLREYLNGIKAGAARLTRLVDDLLRVMELRGRAAGRQARSARAPVADLADRLRALCGRLSQRAAAAGVQFECRLPAQLPPVAGRPEDLLEIIRRLFDNGLKFALARHGSAPRVVLSARVAAGEVVVAVGDNGVGFPPAVAGRLFDLFYQHKRKQFEQQGAGVGLTIAQGLAERLGGRIEATSKEGSGSVFRLFLPVRRGGVAAGRRGARPEVRRPATILLVEDEWYLLQGLRDLLETYDGKYDLSIMIASDGEEGLAALTSRPADLIISDITMPRLNGYQFLDRVRQNQAWLDIPFIFLTARSERHDILHGRTLGVEEYITKPYDSDELFDLIGAQLERRFRRQGVVAEDFEQLKRGILQALLPDLRQPLSAVSDHYERLAAGLDELQTEAQLADYLHAIQAGGRQLAQMALDFVFLAALRTGEAAHDFNQRARPVSLAYAAEAALALARKNGLTLAAEMDAKAQSWTARTDVDLLATAIGRLAELLRAASPQPEATPVLRAWRGRGLVLLHLACPQATFSAERAAEIGRLLAQDMDLTLEVAGRDPALIIAKGVIDLHGGQIALNTDPAGGSAFLVSLPVAAQSSAPLSKKEN